MMMAARVQRLMLGLVCRTGDLAHAYRQRGAKQHHGDRECQKPSKHRTPSISKGGCYFAYCDGLASNLALHPFEQK